MLTAGPSRGTECLDSQRPVLQFRGPTDKPLSLCIQIKSTSAMNSLWEGKVLNLSVIQLLLSGALGQGWRVGEWMESGKQLWRLK